MTQSTLPQRLALGMALGIAGLLAACSKTVTWEEEVLLNTGETILVNKVVTFSIRGQAGNPADQRYASDDIETTSFKYQGKSYTYHGDADLLIIAISPQKVPVLLAAASSRDWYRRHTYKCVNPYYVMFIPDASGKEWTWPDRIEPWTYNLSTNLLLNRIHPVDTRKRFTMADKLMEEYRQDLRTLYFQKIDPLYISDICKGMK